MWILEIYQRDFSPRWSEGAGNGKPKIEKEAQQFEKFHFRFISLPLSILLDLQRLIGDILKAFRFLKLHAFTQISRAPQAHCIISLGKSCEGVEILQFSSNSCVRAGSSSDIAQFLRACVESQLKN